MTKLFSSYHQDTKARRKNNIFVSFWQIVFGHFPGLPASGGLAASLWRVYPA